MSYSSAKWLNCESVCVNCPLKKNSPLPLSLPLFSLSIHTAVTGLPCPVTPHLPSAVFQGWPDYREASLPLLSSPIMRLLATLLFLVLLLPSAEPRRGPRSGALERGAGGHVRGRGRAGVVRRQTQECKEYMEAGEKYLDCQDRQLTNVMQDWPKDIHHLLLARNRIQVRADNLHFALCVSASYSKPSQHVDTMNICAPFTWKPRSKTNFLLRMCV